MRYINLQERAFPSQIKADLWFGVPRQRVVCRPVITASSTSVQVQQTPSDPARRATNKPFSR